VTRRYLKKTWSDWLNDPHTISLMTSAARPRPIRILNAEPLGYSPKAREVLNQLGQLTERELSRVELVKELSDYEVLVVRLAHQIDQEIIDSGTRLEVIVTATTGLDHIDLEYAQQRAITVLSLRGEYEFLRTISATSEHTMALLLALLRRIAPAFSAVQRGIWDRDAFRGNELDGKIIGIIGLGRVGQKIAKYGLAFGMEIIAFDPYRTDWMEGVRRASELGEVTRSCDILSLHVPLNAETEGMIGADELSELSPHAVLINTSRGQLVDEDALVQALKERRLAGAAIDVMSNERDFHRRDQSPLLTFAKTHDNLLITPHIAGATHESMAKTEIFMSLKLRDFFVGRPNLVEY